MFKHAKRTVTINLKSFLFVKKMIHRNKNYFFILNIFDEKIKINSNKQLLYIIDEKIINLFIKIFFVIESELVL